MITILIGTRADAVLSAAIAMARTDGRPFDVVYQSGWGGIMKLQLDSDVRRRAGVPSALKGVMVPLRVLAHAQNLTRSVFLACLNPQTDLILACVQPSKKSAVWLEELLRQEGILSDLRVERIAK